MMQYVGIGIASLLVYIVSIIIINVLLKRKMGEAMGWASLILLIMAAAFAGKDPIAFGADALAYAGRQEVVYAGLAFSFMAFFMDKTGIIERLVTILNSLLGRLPGGAAYVSTIGCALFGMISGVASANTASIGSVMIPWMKQTGWSPERSAEMVAGNGGLGNIFPPSTVMLLILALPAVEKELTAGELYVGLMSVGAFVMAFRLFVVWYFTKLDGIKPIPKDQIVPLGKALKENGSALLIFLGVIIPLMLTMGPTGEWVKANLAGTKGAFKSISIIFWIPVLITLIAALEGWKQLPRTLKGWHELFRDGARKFGDLGALLFFAFVSTRILNKVGLTEEFQNVFTVIGQYSPLYVIFGIAIIITLMVGPFNSTGTTTAVGAACYAAFRAIGIPPVVAAVAFINLVSNQSCVPPNSAPIYIAAGIAGVEDPIKMFKNLVVFYALPEVIISVLVLLRIIPVYGA